MVRESIRQIVEATSGPELIGASRLARALSRHAGVGFDDLLARHAPDLAKEPERPRKSSRRAGHPRRTAEA
jgi:hypothetical protein